MVKVLDFLDLVCGWEDDVLPRMSKAGKNTLRLMEKDKESGEAFLDFAKSLKSLSSFDYWTLLGALYIHGGYAEGVSVDMWRMLFSIPRPDKKYVMQSFERKALRHLPENNGQVTCYRIHHPHEEDWISYTISDWLIPEFVRQYKAHDAFGSVEKFTVAKKDVDFYFGRNGEDEIVVLDRSKVHKCKNQKR